MGSFFKRSLDLASTFTLILTIVLFVVALFEKGLTHDILLEAAIFLISIKLVLSTLKTQEMIRSLGERIGKSK